MILCASILLTGAMLGVHPVPAMPAQNAKNPIIWADVPDPSIVRVGHDYYMSSTTMHMSPGVPIMKSHDLVNWKLISYAYDVLDHTDALDLRDGKNAYGKGSWASCIRYHQGTFYVSTFSFTTGKTYIYSTKSPEKGPWKKISFSPAFHDHSLFFDDDGRVYLVTGAGDIRLVELKSDLSGPKPGGVDQVIIHNASAVAGGEVGLRAEGSQMFKVNGKYYLCNITWPKGDVRTEIVHRADAITGPYEGRVMFHDQGVAQGGMIDTPDGKWYAYLFQDHGAVGRIPFLVPMKWVDGWPVVGVDGKLPDSLDIPVGPSLGASGIVASDEINEKTLLLAWQWNHNPDNALWSLSARRGYLRLTTGRIDSEVVQARNTLTQRTFGPTCSGSTLLDASGLKDGDFAGLVALQGKYGFVGVRRSGDDLSVVMTSAESGKPVEVQSVPLSVKRVYLRIDCDFRNRADLATFFYSLDGKAWNPIGVPLHMRYDLSHFMGYRFGLFNFATKTPGGSADFDWFHIGPGH
ncbi:MAG: glycoside hydrolase 43 family protein [Armatimonadetes bacterium]|nr:glycoside hydrolase 43 family protein [Armatimonadota bacterium]